MAYGFNFLSAKDYTVRWMGRKSRIGIFWIRWKSGCRELVEQKVPFHKRSVHTRDAVKMFREHNMHDKEHLFEYRRVSKVNIYDIDGL